MAFREDRRKWLVEVLGEDLVSRLESDLPALGNSLKARGVRYKEARPEHPARPYLNDLLYDRPAELVASAKAVRQLKESQHPAAAYVSDLIERGPALVEG